MLFLVVDRSVEVRIFFLESYDGLSAFESRCAHTKDGGHTECLTTFSLDYWIPSLPIYSHCDKQQIVQLYTARLEARGNFLRFSHTKLEYLNSVDTNCGNNAYCNNVVQHI